MEEGSEGDGVGRGDAEGVWVWERVVGVLVLVFEAFGASVREERGARASCRERLRMISDFMLIGLAELWSLK